MNTARNTAKAWQEQTAVERLSMIMPLMAADIDPAKRTKLRREIAQAHQISVRSLYRYEKAYREGQFSGLMPGGREKRPSRLLPKNFDVIVEQAIQLRKEVPERSVAQIITILELEGLAAPGVLKRPTLERYLYKAGFGSEHLRAYRQARESSSRRFCKPHRMMLVQADIKYGPKLPIGKNGAKVQTYLSSIIDDHSRYLLHSRFYANQEELIVEDSFHQAILRYGTFDRAYCDNGKQYVSRQLKSSLARLGITINFAPVRSGRSKGKIERFHQVVDAFLAEAKLKPAKSLEQLNHQWEIFLDEYYHKKPHDGIREYYESLGAALPDEGISPQAEFNRDSRALVYLDTSVVSEAFLHHDRRKVDNGACISFKGRRYETKIGLIGQYVEIAYDPLAYETIRVMHPDCEPFTAVPLEIKEYSNKAVPLPQKMQSQKASTSRFLDALERRHEETTARKTDAISFASFRKGGDDNV